MTPTNLLYNVVSTPGALYRYWRQGQTGGRLAVLLIAGTLPGVIAGSVIRVKLIPGPRVFDVLVAAVLIPLGIYLLASRPARTDAPDRPGRQIPALVLVVLASTFRWLRTGQPVSPWASGAWPAAIPVRASSHGCLTS